MPVSDALLSGGYAYGDHHGARAKQFSHWSEIPQTRPPEWSVDKDREPQWATRPSTCQRVSSALSWFVPGWWVRWRQRRKIASDELLQDLQAHKARTHDVAALQLRDDSDPNLLTEAMERKAREERLERARLKREGLIGRQESEQWSGGVRNTRLSRGQLLRG